MKLKEGIILLISFLFLINLILAQEFGGGGTRGMELVDYSNLEQVEGSTPLGEGGRDLTNTEGLYRFKDPIEESVRTPKGDILNAKLENSIFSSGDFVNGKIESFADDNLIPIQSIADPDLSIKLLMNKDGKATVEQYDGYESAPLCFASRSLPFARVLSLALWR